MFGIISYLFSANEAICVYALDPKVGVNMLSSSEWKFEGHFTKSNNNSCGKQPSVT